MLLHAYILLFALAILASLVGVMVVAIPLAAVAMVMAVREEVLALLGSLVRVKPVKSLDSTDAAPAKL